MKKWLLSTLFLCACQPSGNSLSEAPTSAPTMAAIVGGQTVSPKEALNNKVFHLRGLSADYSVRCTASAIAPRIILTAAHCVPTLKAKYRLTLPKNDGSEEYIFATDVLFHPTYSGAPEYRDDLAVLLLQKDLPADVQIMQLPLQDIPLNFAAVDAAGFGDIHGRKNGPAKEPGILRKTKLKVMNFDAKQPTFEVDQSQGQGICTGDSGGPAMIQIENETYVVGIASEVLYFEKNGQDVDTCAYRGKYINVQHYLPWIQSALEQFSKEISASQRN